MSSAAASLQGVELLAEPPHVVFEVAELELILPQLVGRLGPDGIDLGLVLGDFFQLAAGRFHALLGFGGAGHSCGPHLGLGGHGLVAARSFDERATLTKSTSSDPIVHKSTATKGKS